VLITHEAYTTSASDPRGWEYNDEGSYLNGTYPVSNEPRTHFRSMMEKATVYQLDGEGKSCLEVAGLLLPTANDTEKNMLANEVMNGYNSYVRGKATRGSEEVSEQFNNGSTALSKSKC